MAFAILAGHVRPHWYYVIHDWPNAEQQNTTLKG